MITDANPQLQAQIDALTADVQRLRDQLAGAVGLPAPGTAGQGLFTDSALPYWGPVTLGTVTNVSASSPLASSGGATPNISIPAASASLDGYLSSTHWSTFNGKVSSVGASGALASSGGTTPSITHNNSGVSAGSYTNCNITVDARGHITVISNGAGGGGGTWGSITGTLSSQTDLQSALNAKANLSGGNTFSGGIQYCNNQFWTTGASAGFAIDDRVSSTVWAMYAISGTFNFWNSVNGNAFTVTEAGTLSVAALSLPGTTGQYVRGNGTLATTPTGTVTSVAQGNGMSGSTITSSGTVTMGTPSSCTAATSNATTSTSHTHAITGFMPTTGGTFTGAITAPGVTDSSDIRFKRDIRKLRGSMDIISALRPVRFFNTLTEMQEIGFVAQDVRDCLPEVVTTDDNGDLAVAYQRMVAPLVAAMQEIAERVAALEAR